MINTFKIIDIKKDCFLIEINSQYAYVPFDRMPWNYLIGSHWKAVLFSLKQKTFLGKVFRIDQQPANTDSHIYVDATATILKEAQLSLNEYYKGIVIHKMDYGVFVDIGYHFDWECGSLVGILHRSKFPDEASFDICEPGETIAVSYSGRNKTGLIFEKTGQENIATSTNKKEWLEPLIENIEIIKEQNLVVPFKILETRKDHFLIKIQGLYAYAPFEYMPWRYLNATNWDAVLLSLKKKKFFGRVFQIERKPEYLRIYVDATVTRLKEAKLYLHENYEGIVIQKTLFGVFVDIGYHFDWECGSLVGLFHRSKFPDDASFEICESGHTLVVKYLGKNEKGLIFEKEGYVDLNAIYEGKTVRVKVYRDENGYLDFLVQGKYKAKMPIAKSIYGENQKAIQHTVTTWKGGEFIDCEVLNVNNSSETFILKYKFPEEHIINLVGKTVQVRVSKNTDDSLDLMTEDNYRVSMPVTNDIYGEKKNAIKKAKQNLHHGEVIECKALNINRKGALRVQWIPEKVK